MKSGDRHEPEWELDRADARTTEKLWVNMTMVTAIEVSAGYTRIRFDKDNFITVTQKPQQVIGLAGIP